MSVLKLFWSIFVVKPIKKETDISEARKKVKDKYRVVLDILHNSNESNTERC